jgi:hypothetical protein
MDGMLAKGLNGASYFITGRGAKAKNLQHPTLNIECLIENR